MERGLDYNSGIYDGVVGHADVNEALASADLAVLVGEQRLQAHFAADRRLPKLHAGDCRVLAFWQAFNRVPAAYREAFWRVGGCVALCRGAAAVFFSDRRRHQALHVGRRRRTVYLAEGLLAGLSADPRDESPASWALAAGLVHAICLLSDFVLLAGLVGYGRKQGRGRVFGAGDMPLLRQAAAGGPVARKEAEAETFAEAYATPLSGLGPQADTRAEEETALGLWDGEFEASWARERAGRLVECHAFPAVDFDRDLAHPAAYRMAEELGQEEAPRTFEEARHDYRDARRFGGRPPLVDWGRTRLPKPQAEILGWTVRLAPAGLMDFFGAYSRGCPDAIALIHPLWSYICRLSSDPAGVYSLFGRCRALAVAEGDACPEERWAPAVAGICCRLDGADDYAAMVERVRALGEAGQRALGQALGRLELQAADEWAPFKARKQGIVEAMRQALIQSGSEEAAPSPWARRAAPHADAQLQQVLDDPPHRWSSDPVGVMVCRRAYQRQLDAHGPADAEAAALLAALLVRLDRAPAYPRFLGYIADLGAPAVSALLYTLEEIGPDDEDRRAIYQEAQRHLGLALLRYRAARKKRA